MTQTLVIFIIRTPGNPFRSRPATALVLSIVTACAVAMILPYTPLAGWLGFVPLPWSVVLAILAVSVAYLLVVEGVKRYLAGSAPASSTGTSRENRS
ncbi:Magnesium-transporting ATPase, P-type 1 [compost metagenome]